MISAVLSCLLALVPFLLVFEFRERRRGLVQLSVAILFVHFVVGAVTQALGIFTRDVLFVTHSVIAVGVLWWVYLRREKLHLHHKKIHFEWALFFAIMVIAFELWSVHFSYNGVVDSYKGVDIATNASYGYPLYSDEWSAVSLINYSIENQTLPMRNPLWPQFEFINFLAGFHITISEISLFFGLSVLNSYIYFAIINTLIICTLLYYLLRQYGVGPISSASAILLVPLLTNSGNLPLAWFLLPYNFSLLFVITGLLGIVWKYRAQSLLSFAMALIVYPPMIVFVAPLVFIAFGYKSLGIMAIAGSSLIILSNVVLDSRAVLERAWDFVLRENLDKGIVNYGFQDIFPVFSLPFVLLGIWDLLRRGVRELIFPISIGLFFWLGYFFFMPVFVIEHARIVAVTSIFLCITAGFGLDYAIKLISGYFRESHNHWLRKFSIVSFLILFISIAYFFPGIEKWQNLKLNTWNNQGSPIQLSPAPPVNHHLQNDELQKFQEMDNQRFLAPPWKGLVLGAATGNYPLHSKPSTIGVKVLEYSTFLNADCNKKGELAKKYKIDYVYTPQLKCIGWQEVFRSGEGLVLYKPPVNKP